MYMHSVAQHHEATTHTSLNENLISRLYVCVTEVAPDARGHTKHVSTVQP